MPTLILHDVTPVHWAVAGAAIALITVALLAIGRNRLGVSTSFEDMCSLVLTQPYFSRRAIHAGRPWRMPFVIGLVLGGAASALMSGGWTPTWDAGLFDQRIGLGPAGKMLWMFGGGLLIGFGTRLAGGCTSGHGIFGLANFERSSLMATLAFMASGVATTQVIYRVLFA